MKDVNMMLYSILTSFGHHADWRLLKDEKELTQLIINLKNKKIKTMGIQYRKTKITLNYREEKPQVYKLQQLTYPAVTFAQLVNECSSSCGVNPAQTKAVIDALVNRLVHYMEIGHGVKMGDFGSFKPTFNCKSAPTLEEATIEKIKVKKVQFYPGKAFKQMLKDMSLTSASDALSVKDEEGEEAESGEVVD